MRHITSGYSILQCRFRLVIWVLNQNRGLKSVVDATMLEPVGLPTAVSKDRTLSLIAHSLATPMTTLLFRYLIVLTNS